MQLTMIETNGDVIRAGYDCPCGCSPSASYSRGGEIARDVCCCGNEFAVGHDAVGHLAPRDGFVLETQAVASPWDEPVMAAWLVGASVHPAPEDGTHADQHHADDHDDGASGAAIDPVCGMRVDPPAALAKGLHSHYHDTDYFFCGKGCKLEFDDDPEKYLDPGYMPSM